MLDQFPIKADRQSYEMIRERLTPLAKIDQAFIVGMDDFRATNLMRSVMSRNLLACFREVDGSIQVIEFVQIEKVTTDKETVIENQSEDQIKGLWSRALADISQN